MTESISPESRIFHIGRECYVVYLGKERDDYRPFLRIGNIRDIPDEVHQAISTTVVTDDHVGNPLLETINASRFPIRYLGDTLVVREIRKFFQSFDLPTDDITDYRSVKDGEKRHMVWFYSSGNIHLRYDDHVIFNLHKRAKEDRHFVHLYDEAKAEFLRNPLRYIRQDFSGPGVVCSGGNALWYEGGEILSMAVSPGFSSSLMARGVDPDFISAVACNLEETHIDSAEGAVFIGLIKRARQRKKQLRVVTTIPQIQRKLRVLFPARAEVPASLDVADISGRKKASFRDSVISRRNSHRVIHRAGIPEVSFGAVSDAGISVDPEKSLITVKDETGSAGFNVPDGIPVDFIAGGVQSSKIVDRYISLLLGHIKEHFTPEEFQFAQILEKYVRLLRDDYLAGKTSVSPLLKQVSTRACDYLRKVDVKEGGPAWYYYSNVAAYLELFAGEAENGPQLADNARRIGTELKTFLSRLSEPEIIYPFWGDLYLGGEPVLFWRTTKRNFVAADILAARSANERIQQITAPDDTACKADMKRLILLIRSLNAGGEGPLTQEQLALLQKPENKEEQKPQRPAAVSSSSSSSSGSASKTKTVTEQKKDSAGGEEQSRALNMMGTKGRKPVTKKKKPFWLLWLLLLLLLLIGGFIGWDLSGKAPWGSVFGRSDTSGYEENAGSSETAENDLSEAGTSSEASTATSAETSTSTSAETETVSQQQEEAVKPVDADVAPRTKDEVESYLNVNGRVSITEADIHLAANEIAVQNGYKDLDYRVYTGNDPDWIYPGGELLLPGSGSYTVRKGDTIWFLAARQVRKGVEAELVEYDKAVSILKNSTAAGAEKQEAKAALKKIFNESRAKAMRLMAAEALNSAEN